MAVIDKVKEEDPDFEQVSDRIFRKSLKSDKEQDDSLLMHSEDN